MANQVTTQPKVRKHFGKFRILHGKHSEKDENGIPRVYTARTEFDRIHSFSDLEKQNSPNPNHTRKFERLDDDVRVPVAPAVVGSPMPEERQQAVQAAQESLAAQKAPAAAPPQQKPFEQMSHKELMDYATREEIDLKGAKSQQEILKVLKG